MRRISQIAFKLRALLFRSKLEDQLSEEIRIHVDMATEANRANGMSPKEARMAAIKEFGGIEQMKERTRDQRGILWLEQFWQDVTYAFRVLIKSPAFTLTAVVTLGLGIGVNSAIFGLYNTVALQPLPVRDPEGLVRIYGMTDQSKRIQGFSYTEYLDYQESSETLEALIAYINGNFPVESAVVGASDPGFYGNQSGSVPVEFVSDNYFGELGGPIQMGRGLLPEDFEPEAEQVIVLSDQFWEHYFHRDPGVLGSTLTFKSFEDKGEQFPSRLVTVIGVAGAGFLGQNSMAPVGWMPITKWELVPNYMSPGGPLICRLIGRLKAGLAEETVKAELDVIASRRAIEFPSERAKTSVQFQRVLRWANIPLTPQNLARLSPIILGFAMVLVIACTNVVNLLLARSASRQSEMGIRLTLGASRGRIVRQLLTENVLLCVLGAILGYGLGTWTVQHILRILAGTMIPRALLESLDTNPNLNVLGYTALLTAGASIVVGLLPALHTAKANLVATVRNETTEFGLELSPSKLRRLMVIVQVAVCITVLSCAGLFIRNALNPERFAEGYDPETVFMISLAPNPAIEDHQLAFQRALETLERIPEVKGVSAMRPGPYQSVPAMKALIRSANQSGTDLETEVQTLFTTSGFVNTFNASVLRGRSFNALEQRSASRSIIVSKSLAHYLWPGQEALGKSLRVSEMMWKWNSPDHASYEYVFRECEVIGVVNDVKLNIGEDDKRILYLPLPLDVQLPSTMYIHPQDTSYPTQTEIVAKAKKDGISMRFIDPVSASLAPFEHIFHSWAVLSMSLGVLALTIASVGLYGLLSFVVGQRVHEIGIRMAIGATADKVTKLFVHEGMRLVAVGLTLGLVGGGLFALLIEKLFFGLIQMFDPVAYLAVTTLFTAIACFACWLPARRATQIQPMDALRRE